MSDEEFSPIRPKSVPLSHVETTSETPGTRPAKPVPWLQLALVAAVVALLAAVFLIVPDFI